MLAEVSTDTAFRGALLDAAKRKLFDLTSWNHMRTSALMQHAQKCAFQMGFGTIYTRWIATTVLSTLTLADVLGQKDSIMDQWLLFENWLYATQSIAAIINHDTGYDELLESKKLIHWTDLKTKHTLEFEKTLMLKRGLYY